MCSPCEVSDLLTSDKISCIFCMPVTVLRVWKVWKLTNCFTHLMPKKHLKMTDGRGFFFLSCTEDISMAVVLIFCSEGDNIADGFMLINHLNEWLHLLEKPVSY